MSQGQLSSPSSGDDIFSRALMMAAGRTTLHGTYISLTFHPPVTEDLVYPSMLKLLS